MAETPIEFQIYIENSNAQMLDGEEVDIEADDNPARDFAERSAAKVTAGSAAAGLDALSKAAPQWRPPTGDGNPWPITHERVVSQPIEAGPFDTLLQKSAKDESLREWVKRCIDGGDDIESLAEFAAETDPAKAAAIRAIGKTL